VVGSYLELLGRTSVCQGATWRQLWRSDQEIGFTQIFPAVKFRPSSLISKVSTCMYRKKERVGESGYQLRNVGRVEGLLTAFQGQCVRSSPNTPGRGVYETLNVVASLIFDQPGFGLSTRFRTF
jgi:hypothetical protein